MPYIPDLTSHSVVKFDKVASVGYLWVGHAYTKGEVPSRVFEQLVELVEKTLLLSLGFHACNLEPCGSSAEPKAHPEFRLGDRVVPVGSSEIIVPSEDVVFKAPSLILHYIVFHHYQPPERFCKAVVQCPEPGSEEYFEAIRQIAPTYGKVLRFFCGGGRIKDKGKLA